MKIRNFALPIFHQLPKISAFALVFFMLPTFLTASDTQPASFQDLPSNPLWYPAIEVFQQENIIIGDTIGGSPTGKLRPKDYLTRAEFTKVATMVHLLESVQSGELAGNLDEFLNTDLNDFTLKTDALLRPYYTSRPGAPKFSDVPEKDLSCAMDVGGCEPWFTQYVNYMASLGTIKGYTEDGTFRPNNSILRIHALKMVMAENGNVSADEDVKFKRLAEDERVKDRQPRCLTGTEDYILEANGGLGLLDSQNLLAYAFLADKLDIFGNRCQAFADKGISLSNKQAIADYLQSPLTRQEIARYLALTTTVEELQLNPSTDPTVDTKEEYIIPYDPEAMKEWEEKKAEEEAKKKTEQKKAEKDDTEKGRAEDEEEEGPPYGTHPLTRSDLLKYFPDGDIPEETKVGMPFDLMLAITKTGRCCKSKDLYDANCEVIDYSDYAISEESDYNWDTYGGPAWHKATSSRDECWIPTEDIVMGYGKEEIEKADKDKIIEEYSKLLDEADTDHSVLLASLGFTSEMDYLIKRQKAASNITNGIATIEDFKLFGYSREQAEELLEIQEYLKVAKRISNNMNAEIKKGYSAKEICKWALKDKNDKPKEREMVMEWCNTRGVTEDELKPQKIDRRYEFTETVTHIIPKSRSDLGMESMNTRSTVIREDKTLSFEIKKMGHTDSFSSNGNTLYIFIHGQGGDSGSWPRDIAGTISDYIDPNAQILLLDWSNIAPLKNDNASIWIDSIASETVKALKDWGVNPGNTSIIGHALGAVLGAEISKGLGQTNSIVLDPTKPWLTDYIISNNGSKEFAGFSGNEKCLVGARSVYGSESAIKSCGEKYLINYYDAQNHEAIKEFIQKAVINLAKQKTFKAIKGKINLKTIDWKITTKAGLPAVLTASIYIDHKEITLADVELYMSKKAIKEMGKAGCTVMAAGTGPIAPAAKSVCDAITATAVNETIEVIMAALDENDWTAQTYTEIIRHPFYGNILSMNDQRNFSEMEGGFFNIDHNGMIYTERKQPEKIKYLKTKQGGKYVLYGNTQGNVFECVDELNCEMYGYSGNDIFQVINKSKSVEIKDFKSNNGDGDRITIDKYSDMMATPYSDGALLIIDQNDRGNLNTATVTLSVPYWELEGWVKTAKANIQLEKEQWGKTPIIINQFL